MKLLRWAVLLAAIWALPAVADQPPAVDDIRHLLHATFDRPDAELVIEPVVVEGDHAIAGWTQGDMGGRALLRRAHGRWRVVLCAGDALREMPTLSQAGVPQAPAASLVRALAAAESGLDPARLAQLASFEGIMMIEADDPHHGRAGSSRSGG